MEGVVDFAASGGRPADVERSRSGGVVPDNRALVSVLAEMEPEAFRRAEGELGHDLERLSVVPGDGFDDKTLCDALDNAMGGIRYPIVEVPVASVGVGQYALTGDCPEIQPFDQVTLDALYPNRANYLEQYDVLLLPSLRSSASFFVTT